MNIKSTLCRASEQRNLHV